MPELPRGARGLIPALLALSLITACGGKSTTAGPVQTIRSPPARIAGGAPAHVAVIVMENEEYRDVIGSAAAPYLNRLARRSALALHMYAIAHPSLPNYLALTGGSTFGISSDCTSCSVNATGLVDQLERGGQSWKAYMEGLPHRCGGGVDTGLYAKKHDPFAYYTRVTTNPAWCQGIVPLTELSADERSRRLPRFVWITPNLCHDMHDCSPATGDRFLSRLVPPLLAALGRRGLLILTWDEGSTDDGCCRLASGGHVATLLAGGLARRGARLGKAVDHYSTLQAIEDLFGLPRLRGAACPCTPTLAPLLVGGAPPGPAK
jgi:hypothetical protein